MFDLFRSRDKAVRILLGAILVVVALSMVTYLVPGGGMGGGSASDNVVAQVGDETITTLTVQRALQNAMRSAHVPPQYMAVYAPQVIQTVIGDRAMAYEARQQGLKVSDEDVNVSIQNQVPPGYFQDGKLVKRAELESILAQQNLTIADLKNETARQILVARFRSIALEGTVVSPREIEEEFRRRSEKVKIEYVIIAPAKYQSEAKTDLAGMQQYYDKNKTQFQMPAKKSVSYVVFDPVQIEASIQPTDVDLKRTYDSGIERYRVPERAQARHILLMTDKAKNNDAEVKAKAADVLKQVKAGGDFAALAKKFSEDTGSGAKGGDLGWVTHGQMVKPFEDAVFSLKPGQISDLVQTQYGFHIVQVLEREPAHVRSFEEVKPELITAYKKQKVNQLTQQLADKAAADMRRDPAHPEKAAADVNQPLQHADNVVPGDPLPQLGVSKEFEQAISGLMKNGATPPVVLAGNKVAVAVVTSVIPAHPSSFDEAQPEIRKVLEGQSLEVVTSQKASDLAAKAKAMGGDLRKAAQSMGLELKTSTDFDRVGAIEGVGSSTSLPEVFSKPVGDILGPVTVQGNRIIAKIISKTPPNMGELAAQSSPIRDEIKGKRARERNIIFEDGVKDKLTKDGKIKVHQDVINRLISSYRA